MEGECTARTGNRRHRRCALLDDLCWKQEISRHQLLGRA
jgi:hypothetical protein